MQKLTKIIATIGPSSDNPKTIKDLIHAGVNIFRFNTKHNTAEWHVEHINLVSQIAEELKTSVGILVDLQGPEIRIETPNGEPLELEGGDEILVSDEFLENNENPNQVRIAHTLVCEVLEEGDYFSIEDGFHEFVVTKKISPTTFSAKITQNGTVKHRKSLNLVGKDVDLPSLIDEDLDKLNKVAGSKVDFVALSFVRTSEDLKILKREMAERQINAKVVAKIESQKGLDNIDEIIKESDAIMIARGDLGVETPLEQLTVVQKNIIKKCRNEATPVIVATQMLESMMERPMPTRAEAADVANAVFDGTDCVMLSGETATGKYPVRAVMNMSKILAYNEKFADPNKEFIPESRGQTRAVVIAAMTFLNNNSGVNVNKVIIFSETGRTGRVFSSYRPKTQLIVLSDDLNSVESLTMSYGVKPLHMDFPEGDFGDVDLILEKLKDDEHISVGEKVLVVHGRKWQEPGKTNSLFLRDIV